MTVVGTPRPDANIRRATQKPQSKPLVLSVIGDIEIGWRRDDAAYRLIGDMAAAWEVAHVHMKHRRFSHRAVALIAVLSLRTLCKERPGIYVHSYSDLAQVLRKHSASPAEDLAALYRHMVFNAAIGNVDDHLKNFWMLARPGGFRLALAFDLVPDISGRGEHTLAFQQGFACPTGAEMIAVATEWGVTRAARIVEDVVEATRTFAATARRLKVRHPVSLQKVCADVRRRIGLLGP